MQDTKLRVEGRIVAYTERDLGTLSPKGPKSGLLPVSGILMMHSEQVALGWWVLWADFFFFLFNSKLLIFSPPHNANGGSGSSENQKSA